MINVDKVSASGRLSARFARSAYLFSSDHDTTAYKDGEHIAKYPVYNFRRNLLRLGYKESYKPVAPLDIRLSPFEIDEGKKALNKLINSEKKTICLFTYATGDKCYTETWWASLYEKLKSTYPGYNIIEILPVENISKISFKAPIYSNKNIREVGAVIANTKFFIGADSGIMHLASAVKTITIGLFSITNENTYKPYNGTSVAINTNKISEEECFRIIDHIISSASS